MMRSLYSGVAGLKIHQTKMDVIGNNIANVNTVGFKSSSVNFSDTFYQTVSSATGPNADTNTAGTNAKQIGLGGLVASITTNVTENGGTTTTNRALDVAINGESFLVVNVNGEQLFTKSGALNVDSAGNLYCTTNGGIVQGWMANENGEIVKDIATDLKVMTAEQTSAAPTATKMETMLGNIDPNDSNLAPVMTKDENDEEVLSGGGVPMTFSFYDNLGELYTVKLMVTQDETSGDEGDADTGSATVPYTVRVADVFNSDGESIFVEKSTDANGTTTYKATGAKITFGSANGTGDDATINSYGISGTVNETTGEFTLDPQLSQSLTFNSSTGAFGSVCTDRANSEYAGKSINFSVIQLNDGTLNSDDGATVIPGDLHTGENSSFPQYDPATDTGGIEIDFSNLTQYSKGGTSEVTYQRGDVDGNNAGNYAGTMSGISIDSNGKVYGTYTNGETKCLAQICVATFSNPSGLEAEGESLFSASLNSGLFDGVGEEISTSGSFTVGALEMSNVDLATEFTNMITTQRGFQANSRIITTSDTMLEELVNLKR
jgi:flagellar hook protein FlgE